MTQPPRTHPEPLPRPVQAPSPLPLQPPAEYKPFDDVEYLPGLGWAVLWVVLAYVFVNLLLLPPR